MPVYCYECSRCGGVTEMLRFNPDSESGLTPGGVRCEHCGGAARRSYQAEAGRPRAAGCGEIRSMAAGVLPEHAAQAQRGLTARGIDGVRFDPATGDAIFRDRQSRLRAIKAMGLHDRNEIRG